MEEKGENILNIIFAYSKKQRAKVRIIGSTLHSLSLLIAISKFVIEKISKERHMNTQDAENFVIDCIKDGIKFVGISE